MVFDWEALGEFNGLGPDKSELQRQYAIYIIQCDQDILDEPDEKGDVMEDVRTWAVDLAGLILSPEEINTIRTRSTK